jgi:hypothetical protein
VDDDVSSGEETAEAQPPLGDIFISYRRDDAPGQATALKKALAEHFGTEHVFMDVANLRPGENFVREIQRYVARCDVLIVLIGRNWAPIMEERTKRRRLDSATDYVRVELEEALQRDSDVTVLPALVDGAVMPPDDTLPRPIRGLCQINAAELRHSRWDDDVQALIERIEEILSVGHVEPEPVVDDVKVTVGVKEPVTPREPRLSAVSPPDTSHYEDVAKLILKDNAVIPFLGPGVNQADLSATANVSVLRNDELAARLAQEFDYGAEPADLAEISQFVLWTKGKAPLQKALRKILTASFPPGPVHRFLAGLPTALNHQRHEQRCQLIATVNYDDALEQAFDEHGEPYDLAIYMAQGEYKGKFLHVPWGSQPQVVVVANDYVDFPIDEYGNVERTIILKVHGAFDRARSAQPSHESYVITEDDYIDYMSRTPIESLVPVQLLNTMRENYVLFLGYPVRDWNSRVFLQRVWGEQPLGAKSWSIASNAEIVEKKFWNEFGVDLFDVALTTYCNELGGQLSALDEARR